MELSEMMNAIQAAEFLGVHVETLRKLARRNEIPCFKIGRDWRFQKEALLRWVEQQSRSSRPPEQWVLIVDDDEPVCRAMAKVLERMGLAARYATTARQGLEQVQAAVPDLILLDLNMPEMNGPQFLEELRKTHLLLPVVIVTGHPDSTMMRQAMRHAPLLLLEKPVERDLLERTVSSVLGETLTAAG